MGGVKLHLLASRLTERPLVLLMAVVAFHIDLRALQVARWCV